MRTVFAQHIFAVVMYLCITAANACFDEPKAEMMEYCIENLNALVKVAEEENVILLLGTVMEWTVHAMHPHRLY